MAGRHWPELLALIVLLQTATAYTLALRYNLGPVPWAAYYEMWSVPAAAIYVCSFLWWLTRNFVRGTAHPIRLIRDRVSAIRFRSLLEFGVPILVIPPFMSSATILKVLISHVTIFDADPDLSRIDGLLGFQPWQLTHALIGPLGTVILDRTYFLWILTVQAMLLAILFVPSLARHRAQTLLTFVGTWIFVGGIVAVLIPSVGPCFYGNQYGVTPYSELMSGLGSINHSHHLYELDVQQALWTRYVQGGIGIGSGISAMPSMHVALAAVTALLLGRLELKWLGWLWVGIIWIGSIHLGWHYAVDGIVAGIGTLLIWNGVAAILPPQQAQLKKAAFRSIRQSPIPIEAQI